MPDNKGKALLTDIGTEELNHVEMICTMLYQLTKGASLKELSDVCEVFVPLNLEINITQNMGWICSQLTLMVFHLLQLIFPL